MNDFTHNVLHVVARIPEGQVLAYKEVAKRAGNPKAYRAVGNIMAKNFGRAIPCHRVIRSDGTAGDYNRGGTTRKRALLKKEGVQVV